MQDILMEHCASAFLANLGGLTFKIFGHVAPPNHGGASLAPSASRLFKIPVSAPGDLSKFSIGATLDLLNNCRTKLLSLRNRNIIYCFHLFKIQQIPLWHKHMIVEIDLIPLKSILNIPIHKTTPKI